MERESEKEGESADSDGVRNSNRKKEACKKAHCIPAKLHVILCAVNIKQMRRNKTKRKERQDDNNNTKQIQNKKYAQVILCGEVNRFA